MESKVCSVHFDFVFLVVLEAFRLAIAPLYRLRVRLRQKQLWVRREAVNRERIDGSVPIEFSFDVVISH